MADLVPPNSQAAPPGDPTQSDPSMQAPAPDAGVGGDALNATTPQGPRAKGTVEDANNAIQQVNPTLPQQPTKDEQAQYDQFVSRFLLILSDTSKSPPSGPSKPGTSMHSTIIGELNNPHVPLAVAIGQTTAHIAMMMVHLARVQKITYSAGVLFHATFECVSAVYLMGLAEGIFQGVPPFKGFDHNGHYDFDADEMKILVNAQAQAVRVFGNMAVKSGMISPEIQKGNMEFWQQQVQREIRTGVVNQDAVEKIQGELPSAVKPPADGQQPQGAATPSATPPGGDNNAGGLPPQPPLPQQPQQQPPPPGAP